MYKLSIIIPHYENWDMLKALLDTTPKEGDVEVIVVDDKSNGYDENIDDLKVLYKNVKFIRNDGQNKGAGAARNIGLKYASGKWLFFADSDDLLSDDFYRVVSSYFDSKYDLIYFLPDSFIDGTSKQSDRHVGYEELCSDYYKEQSEFNELKLRYRFEPPWSKLIRKKIVDQNNIKFEEIMYSNDTLFSAKVGFYSDEIVVDMTPIYFVRERSGGLTSTTNEKQFRIRFHAWLDYVSFLRDKLSSNEYDSLYISCSVQLVSVVKNKLGFRNVRYIWKHSRKHSIPFLDSRLLSPAFTFRKIKQYFGKKG